MLTDTQKHELHNLIILYFADDKEFKDFAILNKASFGVDYVKEISDGDFAAKTLEYITKVELNETIGILISKIRDIRSDVTEIKRFYDKYIEYINDPAARQFADYKHIIVDFESKVFIDRSNLQNYLFKMANNKAPRVLLIDGQPKLGHSYIKYYLKEISEKKRNFQFIDIDLNFHIQRLYDGQLIFAKHIAKHLLDRLGINSETIDLSKNESSKYSEIYSEFISPLTTYLSQADQVPLFFLHQFDIPLSENVLDFLERFVSHCALSSGNTKYFIIISGLNHIIGSDSALERLKRYSNVIQISSFEEADIDEFFKSIYQYLLSNPNKKITFSQDEFLESLKRKKIVLKKHYQKNNCPNVELIGERVNTWWENVIGN